MTQMTAQGHIPVRRQRKDGQQGPQGPTGPQGPGGDDAVAYKLLPSPTAVSFERDALGQYIRSSIPVNCGYQRTEGNSQPVVTPYSEANQAAPYVYLRTYTQSGGWADWRKATSSNVGPTVTNLQFCLSTADAATDVTAANTLDTADVAVMRDGARGSQGATGRMGYPAGEWSPDTTYTRTATTTPIVHLVVAGTTTEYWTLNADTATGNAQKPADGSSVWAPCAYFDFLISRMLFTMFAKLGGFVVAGDFFISQYGTLIDQDGNATTINIANANTLFPASGTDRRLPYAWFDGDDPMATMTPDTYAFRPVKVVNAVSGEEWMASGRVHVTAGGDVSMNGISVNNAHIRGSLMYSKVVRELSQQGTPIALSTGTTQATLQLRADTLIITGPYDSDLQVQLPPAKFFAGARVRIVNGTYHSENGRLVADPSIVTLNVLHTSATEAAVEDASLVQINSLAVGTPFQQAGVSQMAFYDYYTSLSFDEYSEVELLATQNFFHSPTSPYYVWLIIATR